MNADEVVRIDEAVKALHRLSVLLVTPDSIVCCEAADLIESLQAQLAAERAKYAELQRYNVDCTKACDRQMVEILELREQSANLAESQRRERAAVEDINSMLDNVDSVICCHYCAKSDHGEYCGFDSEGENGELVHCPGEWRGPMNAERQIRHE